MHIRKCEVIFCMSSINSISTNRNVLHDSIRSFRYIFPFHRQLHLNNNISETTLAMLRMADCNADVNAISTLRCIMISVFLIKDQYDLSTKSCIKALLLYSEFTQNRALKFRSPIGDEILRSTSVSIIHPDIFRFIAVHSGSRCRRCHMRNISLWSFVSFLVDCTSLDTRTRQHDVRYKISLLNHA